MCVGKRQTRQSKPANGEGPLDCVDAFAAFRRILRPERLEDIYDPLDGAAGDGLDDILSDEEDDIDRDFITSYEPDYLISEEGGRIYLSSPSLSEEILEDFISLDRHSIVCEGIPKLHNEQW